jgi:hypothetical protein
LHWDADCLEWIVGAVGRGYQAVEDGVHQRDGSRAKLCGLY